MFDLKEIRDEPEAFDRAMARRGLQPVSARILELDQKRRDTQTKLQDAQATRNDRSKQIGQAKAKGEDAQQDLIDEVAALKDRMRVLEDKGHRLSDQLEMLLSGLPNLPFDDVPVGADETDNEEIRRWGDKPSFDFPPKQHFEIGEALGLMDFEMAARLAGSRFVLLRGALARLERALAQYMLDIQTGESGYQEISTPLLVRDEVLYGTGQLPKFAADLFRTNDGRWLIPTAEAPLTNLGREQILDEEVLPLRVAALTPCFRSEAGAAGRDTRGMLRQHQFQKVELVSIAHPDHSMDEHERMTGCAEKILQSLGLHYRVVSLCAGDLGFGARKTYDLEVWMPGQDRFREISSCSNCGDFQARRMRARFRPAGGKKTRFVHTLNGSGLAVGRALIAVLETYQRADGGVTLPELLTPYMGGLTELPFHDG